MVAGSFRKPRETATALSSTALMKEQALLLIERVGTGANHGEAQSIFDSFFRSCYQILPP
jgi:hypothetical protein